MADTGHAGTHAPQSMHSSGLMKSIVACSNSGSSLRGWMQSTGQTSTHAVSLVLMQGSVMTKGISLSLHKNAGDLKETGGESLTEEQKRDNVIRLAFGGRRERLQE